MNCVCVNEEYLCSEFGMHLKNERYIQWFTRCSFYFIVGQLVKF